MKTQNTTSNTAVSFAGVIIPVASMTSTQSTSTAANSIEWADAGIDMQALGEEVSYWAIVAVSFAFQLLLVDLLTIF